MMWAPCSTCGEHDVWVYDGFDASVDIALCGACEEAAEEEWRRSRTAATRAILDTDPL